MINLVQKMVLPTYKHSWWVLLRKFFFREDVEAQRHRWLMQHGRIIEGIVLDLIQDGCSVSKLPLISQLPCTVSYRYNISGVTYESSQVLDENQMKVLGSYIIGKTVTIRYDFRHPANGMIV